MRGEGREGQSPEARGRAIALLSWRGNSETLRLRRSRDAGSVARVGGASAHRRASRKSIRTSCQARDTPKASAPDEARRRKRREASGNRSFPTSTSQAGEARESARARVARRTWTLDALRAATEPVKVEAMQAILLFRMGVVCGVFAGMPARSRRAVVLHARRPRFCQLGRFFPVRFLPYGEAVTFSRRKRFARVGLFSCQPGRENRASPRKRLLQDFQVAGEIDDRQ